METPTFSQTLCLSSSHHQTPSLVEASFKSMLLPAWPEPATLFDCGDSWELMRWLSSEQDLMSKSLLGMSAWASLVVSQELVVTPFQFCAPCWPCTSPIYFYDRAFCGIEWFIGSSNTTIGRL